VPDCGGRGIEEPWSERADQPDFMKTSRSEVSKFLTRIYLVAK